MSTLIFIGSAIPIETWVAAITSSACIGFTSLVPWLFNMTFFEQDKLKKDEQNGNGRMEYLLSFSVGAILGDIFFHLIPESLETHRIELNDSFEIAQKKVGLSIISGIFMFIAIEILLEKWSNKKTENDAKLREHSREKEANYSIINDPHNFSSQTIKTDLNICGRKTKVGIVTKAINNNDETTCNECEYDRNGNELSPCSHLDSKLKSKEESMENIHTINTLDASDSNFCQAIDPAGYLSLIANGFDNFTHGLAIGASFLAGSKVGLLTTFVIFIHEIPHEICDYAILVNSGFSRWNAVKAQSSVSLFGIMGTVTAMYVKSIKALNAQTVWILPFSAGGFLHIALVNLLPEILGRKASIRDTIEQIGFVIIGVVFMGLVALA